MVKISLQVFALCLSALVVAGVAQADALIVKAGEEITLSESQSRLQLDELRLEDGAVVRFAPEVTRWQVSASRAFIGNNVRIVGAGVTGSDGQRGQDASGQAAECNDGDSGAAGKAGGKGGPGVVIAMNLKIAHWGSMTIDTQGGAGGVGGAGGQGQQAGEVDKCSQTRGGTGGDGGDGGDGGNGGNVRIRYSYLADTSISDALEKRLTIRNEGGQGGEPGVGGPGGVGTDGKYINMRTLTGSKKWVAGGRDGNQGDQGKPGRTGVDGQILIEEDLAGLLDKKMQQQSAQVNQIRQQLKQELALEAAKLAAQAAGTGVQSQNQQQPAKVSGNQAEKLREQLLELRAAQAEQQARISALETELKALRELLNQALQR